jgi:hypothetical protein
MDQQPSALPAPLEAEKNLDTDATSGNGGFKAKKPLPVNTMNLTRKIIILLKRR